MRSGLSGGIGLAFGIALAGLVDIRAVADDLDRVPVDSFEVVATDAFQEIIAAAATAGESWVYDPLQVALRLVGRFDGKSQMITRDHDSAEAARVATIVVVEDGYLDDSVRGTRHQITLEVDSTGVWRPDRVARAWRCWPDRGHQHFAAAPCR